MFYIGDVGELKGIGGAETDHKVLTLIPQSKALGLSSFWNIFTVSALLIDQ